jgi:hypothetical protein
MLYLGCILIVIGGYLIWMLGRGAFYGFLLFAVIPAGLLSLTKLLKTYKGEE